MDQLAAFKNAPPALVEHEVDLFRRANVVFTGGHALYEQKKALHKNIHVMPSSVDVPHFAQARAAQPEPSDQKPIARPRLGFFGVVDERMDLELLAGVAAEKPDWQLVILGPVVKIDEANLPRASNIHYLGAKSYSELPRYISSWDVAILPFARNESTEFISPTKTPEYLAAGKPVVSTSIRDVIRPYQRLGMVRIADTVPEFVAACGAALAEPREESLRRVDAYLSHQSWDRTWDQMQTFTESAIRSRRGSVSGLITTAFTGAASDVAAGGG